MQPERPITVDEIAALRGQIESTIASGQDRAQLQFAGVSLDLERDSSGQYRLSRAGLDVTLIFHAQSRPTAYPVDAPFVPGELVMWSQAPDGWSLTWPAPPDPESVLASIHAQCVADGWATEERVTASSTALRRVYIRHEQQRFVTRASGIIALTHKQRRAV